LWGQTGEELKKSGKFQCFLLRILKLLSFYYHQSSNNLTNNGKCIPWQWAEYLMEITAGLLSRAVLEGDWTRRTVWTQTILTERRCNGDGTETWRIVWIGPKASLTSHLSCFSLYSTLPLHLTPLSVSLWQPEHNARQLGCDSITHPTWMELYHCALLSEVQHWLAGLKCLFVACNKLSNRSRPKQLNSVPQTIPTQNHSPRQASGVYCGERQWAPRGYIHTVMSWRLSTPIIDGHEVGNGNIVSS